MLVVAAPVGAFAEGSTNQVKVISKYEEKDKFIKGTIDFQIGFSGCHPVMSIPGQLLCPMTFQT